MILPISLTIAGACALLHIWLSVRVSQMRRLHKVSVGDGDNHAVRSRMRALGNFAENVPIFLILLALVELGEGSEFWLWIVAILFVVARVLHAFGMDRTGANALRLVGIVVSWLVLLGLGAYAIVLSYGYQGAQGRQMQLVPARAEAPRSGG